MRALLAHAPLTPAGEVTPPLGLCTLASWLRAAGHDVRSSTSISRPVP